MQDGLEIYCYTFFVTGSGFRFDIIANCSDDALRRADKFIRKKDVYYEIEYVNLLDGAPRYFVG